MTLEDWCVRRLNASRSEDLGNSGQSDAPVGNDSGVVGGAQLNTTTSKVPVVRKRLDGEDLSQMPLTQREPYLSSKQRQKAEIVA
jgi:hypothetical protein